MILDFRLNGELTTKQAQDLSHIESSIHRKYNEYIGSIIHDNNLCGIDLLLQVTCRNTHLSKLLEKLCKIELLIYYLEQGIEIEKILVDDARLKIVILRCIKRFKSDIEIDGDIKSRYDSKIIVYNFFKTLYFALNSFIWPRIIYGKKKPRRPIIYLDSFLFIDSFYENKLQDRYYPGLVDLIGDEYRDDVWYVPTLIGINKPSRYLKILKSIRETNTNILIKEDWLTLKDYIEIFWNMACLPRKVNRIPEYESLDISDIVKSEIRKEYFSTDLFNSLLPLYFIKRIKHHDIKVSSVIDWNENQTIDRSLVLGIKHYYPGVKVKGYQGYIVPDYYVCKDPTCYEVSLNTVPDIVYVVGKEHVANKKKYCKELNVCVAPAFRFSNIYQTRINLKSKNILVVLPISIQESREILALCNKTSKNDGTLKFIIKPHPSYTIHDFKKSSKVRLDNNNFIYSNEDTYKLLGNCKILVSSSSSVCLEAALLGLYVIIIGSKTGPEKNPLKSLRKIKNWTVCYSEDELLKSCRNSYPINSYDISDYFEPVTHQAVRKFIAK